VTEFVFTESDIDHAKNINAAYLQIVSCLRQNVVQSQYFTYITNVCYGVVVCDFLRILQQITANNIHAVRRLSLKTLYGRCFE